MNFNPMTSIYSKGNACFLANISNLVYEKDEKKIETAATLLGYKAKSFSIEKESIYDTECTVFYNDSCVIVAFRGTEPGSLKDWLTDAQITFASYLNVHVHHGFSHALSLIFEDVLKFLDSLRMDPHPRTYWFTGHSLGAALATLMATRLCLEKKWPVNGVYTYGSPRVGDGDFARMYNSHLLQVTFRHVNNNDVVTRVPSRVFSYDHVGQLRYFDSSGNCHTDITHWNLFLDRINGDWKGFFILDHFKDHLMKNYCALSCNDKPCE
ncbi:MAG: lipase class 3 [Magnetococcales bacterium]|nr:lipase class 3 [Magnetococcales bacterium]HIJ85827.1 lipase family protein [Magnetococcales bacterium]